MTDWVEAFPLFTLFLVGARVDNEHKALCPLSQGEYENHLLLLCPRALATSVPKHQTLHARACSSATLGRRRLMPSIGMGRAYTGWNHHSKDRDYISCSSVLKETMNRKQHNRGKLHPRTQSLMLIRTVSSGRFQDRWMDQPCLVLPQVPWWALTRIINVSPHLASPRQQIASVPALAAAHAPSSAAETTTDGSVQ